MKTSHYIMLALFLMAAYLVGVKYPGPGSAALSKVGM